MVEVIVAAMIGLSVLAVTGMGMRLMITSSTSAEARERADSHVTRISDALTEDLRGARARDRSGIDAPTPAELSDRLVHGLQLQRRLNNGNGGGGCRSVAQTNTCLDVRDITVATSTRLVFQADAISDPTVADDRPECIEYRLVDPTPGTWAVTRTVRAYSHECGDANAAVLQRDELVGPVNVSDAARPSPLFRFDTRYNTTPAALRGQCVTARVPVATGGALTQRQVNGIRTIILPRVDAAIQRGRRASPSEGSAAATVRSRVSYDYAIATGCAA